jgi:hypothetical protein
MIHVDIIICPACHKRQGAIAEDETHRCIKCKHDITKSEWKLVSESEVRNIIQAFNRNSLYDYSKKVGKFVAFINLHAKIVRTKKQWISMFTHADKTADELMKNN